MPDVTIRDAFPAMMGDPTLLWINEQDMVVQRVIDDSDKQWRTLELIHVNDRGKTAKVTYSPKMTSDQVIQFVKSQLRQRGIITC